MSKQKTKQLVTNRIRVTKSGKLLRRRAFARHLNVGKSKKRLRRLHKMTEVKEPFAKKLRNFLGKSIKRKNQTKYDKS
jgi:large subunit ribosomal protein L35